MNLSDFDLGRIAQRRVENALLVEELLSPLNNAVDPLWPRLPAATVPQTYPVVVRGVSRDELYFRMNDAGFGVVSLYHTMVEELEAERFPASHRLARRILNLPIHQDAEREQIEAMVRELERQVRELESTVMV